MLISNSKIDHNACFANKTISILVVRRIGLRCVTDLVLIELTRFLDRVETVFFLNACLQIKILVY